MTFWKPQKHSNWHSNWVSQPYAEAGGVDKRVRPPFISLCWTELHSRWEACLCPAGQPRARWRCMRRLDCVCESSEYGCATVCQNTFSLRLINKTQLPFPFTKAIKDQSEQGCHWEKFTTYSKLLLISLSQLINQSFLWKPVYTTE